LQGRELSRTFNYFLNLGPKSGEEVVSDHLA